MAKSKNAAPAVPAAPAAAPSAAPGTEEGKKKRKAPVRTPLVDCPALFVTEKEGEEPKRIKLKELLTTEQFNPSKHKPLTRKDFEAEYLFYEHRAVLAENKAVNLRAKAEESKKLGNVGDAAKAKKLLKMQKAMAELQAQLAAQGVDVAALMAVNEPEEETAAE